MLGLAAGDAALLIGNYNLVFWLKFDRWAGITGTVATVVTIWLGAAYLLGRYSHAEDPGKDNIFRRATATAATASIVLVFVVVGGSWLLGAQDPRAFRSFVIPVICASVAGSTIAQEITKKQSHKAKAWELIASNAEKAIIEHELRANPPMQPLHIHMGSSSEDQKYEVVMKGTKTGYAISDNAEISEVLLEKLLASKSRGIAVCSLTRWCENSLQRIPPELFTNRLLAQAEGFNLQPRRSSWRLKRLGDLSLGIVLLLMSAPLIAVAAIAVALEDGGPVFYSQIRTGLYGEPIRIWKIRSMHINAEKIGAQWSKLGDKRITIVGNWLRKLRIDELPQLVSVIKGEMSLIGPRPERPEIEAVLEDKIPHYRVRHWIMPGLSGWAQVCYPYGASVEDSRMKLSYDLFYLRNAGLALDLLILLKTIRLIVNRRGAIAREGENGASVR